MNQNRQKFMGIFFALFLATGLFCCTKPAPAIEKLFPLSLSHPESVLVTDDSIFIGDIGTEMSPQAIDGDGSIARIDRKTGKMEKPWIRSTPESPLNAPKGMARKGDHLYVADVDVIRVISILKGRIVGTLDLSSTGTKFLNDLVFINPSSLLVSSTDTKTLYRVDPEAGTFHRAGITDLNGINGLAYDSERENLYIATLGKDEIASGGVYRVALSECRALVEESDQKCPLQDLHAPAGRYDGIAVDANHRLIVSDWVEFAPGKGRIMEYSPGDDWKEIPGLHGFSGSADIALEGNDLYVPEMLSGKVNLLNLKDE